MRHGLVSWLLLAMLGLCAGVSGRAWSQTEGPESARDARKLFQQGITQAKQGDWTGALNAFEQTYRITKEPSALFNLAGAQLHLGHMLESNANYHRFLLLRDPRITSAHREAAEAQLASIEKRIPRLRLYVVGLRPEDRLIVDTQRLYPPDLDHEQWLNPGLHVVTVYRQSGESETHRITLLEEEHKTLSIDVR